jgi:hypothetical protein
MYYKTAFQEWNVIYSDVKNRLNTSKIKQNENSELTTDEIEEKANQIKTNKRSVKDLSAVDEGGPTREFLNTFFCQIEDLVVYLPVREDKMPLSSELFGQDEYEYMTPKIGWKIEDHNEKKKGRVLKYNPSTNITTIAFSDHEVEMRREDFKIIGIPIRLFEADTCLPCRDHTFQVNRSKNDVESKSYILEKYKKKLRSEGFTTLEIFNRITKFTTEQAKNLSLQITSEISRIDDQLWRMLSKYDKNVVRVDLEKEVGAMMRLFYRAFGRLILHIIFDGDNVLSPKILSKFLRNGKCRSRFNHEDFL